MEAVFVVLHFIRTVDLIVNASAVLTTLSPRTATICPTPEREQCDTRTSMSRFEMSHFTAHPLRIEFRSIHVSMFWVMESEELKGTLARHVATSITITWADIMRYWDTRTSEPWDTFD